MTTTADVAQFAKYNDFWLDTEVNNYALHIGAMAGGTVCKYIHQIHSFKINVSDIV